MLDMKVYRGVVRRANVKNARQFILVFSVSILKPWNQLSPIKENYSNLQILDDQKDEAMLQFCLHG